MKNLPTLRQLRYLVTLRDQLHFSKAAERCFVTQSTLSAGIQELEALLGAVLVERTKRTVVFTPLGDEIVERARGILRETDEIIDVVDAQKAPLSGTIRLGVIPTIAPFLLPRALPALRRAYPDLKLHLKEDMSHILCDDLSAGRLDAVLYALPYPCGDVEQVILFEDPFFAAFPGGDAPDAATVSVGELEQDRMLLLEEGHCLREHALAACGHSARGSVGGYNTLLATSLHTLVQMVDNGLGITLLPKMAMDGGVLRGTSIETRPLAGNPPARQIGLIWRKRTSRSDDYRLLAEFLKSN